jgi:hypothetical protein
MATRKPLKKTKRPAPKTPAVPPPPQSWAQYCTERMVTK